MVLVLIPQRQDIPLVVQTRLMFYTAQIYHTPFCVVVDVPLQRANIYRKLICTMLALFTGQEVGVNMNTQY